VNSHPEPANVSKQVKESNDNGKHKKAEVAIPVFVLLWTINFKVQ